MKGIDHAHGKGMTPWKKAIRRTCEKPVNDGPSSNSIDFKAIID